jgi:ABC-type glycerol-3-phosphate transport system permease component
MNAGVMLGGRAAPKRKRRVLAYTILIGLSIPFGFPLVWSVSTSLQSLDEVYSQSLIRIPSEPQWHNYVEVFRYLPLGLFLTNTVWITCAAVLGELMTAPLVGYAFARLRFPFRDTLFVVMLSTLMLPPIVTVIPTYILFSKLGWVDTWIPLILPGWLGGGVFAIFIYRQFFLSVPLDLEDAARIDGCSNFGIYLRIFLPLAFPALATIGVLSFVNIWNDFQGPLIYLQSIDRFPISLGINMFKDAYSTIAPHYLMAASVIALAPLLLLFLAIQKVFVEGIILSGIKG